MKTGKFGPWYYVRRLRRLGHRPAGMGICPGAQKDGDSIATIRKSLGEGKVCWIGLSNFSVGQMKRAQTIEPVTSLHPPYSLIR